MQLSDIQPQYFPRLHYFARMLSSDVFIIRDEVQFVRAHRYPDGTRGVSYQAHTPIKTADGVRLLKISVQRGSFLPIYRTGVSYDQPWVRKQMDTLRAFYRSTRNAGALLPEIEQLLACRFPTVADLDIATICWALGRILGEALAIPDELSIARVNELLDAERATRLRRIILGSECAGAAWYRGSSASERTLALCKMAGADHYVGGGTAIEAYLDVELFRRNGIEVTRQAWTCPTYHQRYTGKVGFCANLSILDLMMNEPMERLASLLDRGRERGR